MHGRKREPPGHFDDDPRRERTEGQHDDRGRTRDRRREEQEWDYLPGKTTRPRVERRRAPARGA